MGAPLKVLMLPWLAHGHISPFLELAKKLTKRNITIYLCSTPILLHSSATNRLKPPYSDSIHLVDIHLPSLPDLPPHYHTTNGLPPHLMETLKTAFQMSKPDLLAVLCDVRPDVVIHDTAIMWAAEVAWSIGIPSVDFLTFSATLASYYLNTVACSGLEYPFPEIYLHEFEKDKILSQLRKGSNDDFDSCKPGRGSCNLRLIKSFREIEGKYIDHFAKISNKPVIPVGPLVNLEPEPGADDSGFVQWLDKKENRSCIFVSFGSECFLMNEEIEEIAYGLELSNVDFIWVVRVSKAQEGVNVEDVLPNGYIDRMGDRGRIVDGWAPQSTILRHRGIGGFMSHCGWSSVLESMTFGVPIIAMPMQLDQPLNARLVVEVGVGLEVERAAGGGRIDREAVAKVVREVLLEDGGEHVRRRSKELSEELSLKGEEEIDKLAEQLISITTK